MRRHLCQEVAMEKDFEQKTDDEKVVDNVNILKTEKFISYQ